MEPIKCPAEFDLMVALFRGGKVVFSVYHNNGSVFGKRPIVVSIIGMCAESTANRHDWTIKGFAEYQGVYPSFGMQYNSRNRTGQITIGGWE